MRALALTVCLVGACFAAAVSAARAKTCQVDAGKPSGRYDRTQAAGCEKSCAVKLPYKESQLAPQPGAPLGRLARCPVSGVVFRTSQQGAAETVGGKTYRFCCRSCARLFRRDPSKFLRPPEPSAG